MDHSEYIERWKKEVYENNEYIDPNDEQDWYSMALGFGLGVGLTPYEAHQFAGKIRNSPWG